MEEWQIAVIVIVAEGVLINPVAQTPIVLGKKLYRAFCATERVLLISGETPKDELEGWLFMEGMTGHAEVQYPDPIRDHGTGWENWGHRVWQVNQLRKRGYDIEVIIEPDPQVCAHLLREGFNTMVFTHAAYAIPSWRPDYEGAVRPWDELASEVGIQAVLRERDKRTSQMEEYGG